MSAAVNEDLEKVLDIYSKDGKREKGEIINVSLTFFNRKFILLYADSAQTGTKNIVIRRFVVPCSYPTNVIKETKEMQVGISDQE
jgi:hypothetical protein